MIILGMMALGIVCLQIGSKDNISDAQVQADMAREARNMKGFNSTHSTIVSAIVSSLVS